MLLSDIDSRWHDRLSLFSSTALLHIDSFLVGDLNIRNKQKTKVVVSFHIKKSRLWHVMAI